MLRKMAFYLCIILLTPISLVSPMNTQTQANNFPFSPSKYGVPEFIGGYKSLAVLSSEDTTCFKRNALQLILLSNTVGGVEDFLKQSNAKAIDDDLQKLEISSSVLWVVSVVSPNTTQDDVIRSNSTWNDEYTNDTCIVLSPTSVGSNGDQIPLPAHYPGYALFEDTDASSYSDDNAQSVFMTPPTPIGNNQNTGSALLNNVVTRDNPLYFIQNGLVFQRTGNGLVVYTNSSLGLSATPYQAPIFYNMFHDYWFTISYTNGSWWMCVDDMGVPPGTAYSCIEDSEAPNTSISSNLNSNVFLENFNTNANWYTGFGPFKVYGAKIYRNGFGQNWVTEHKHTGHACSTSYPPFAAMGGTLVGGGIGYFNLANVPLLC